MFWEFFSLSKLASHAEAMRRRHSAWLTRAMRRPAAYYPRIPTRPVGEGGFAGLMATPGGRDWADQWWAETLQSDELDL
jgi:hypothetical protein